jgi:hypothetical protein
MIVTPDDSRNLDKVLKLIGKTPDECVLDIDWSTIQSEPRQGRSDRSGRGRERGDRDRSPRGRGRHVEATGAGEASTTPIAQPAQPTAPQARAEEDVRPPRRARPPRAAEPLAAEAAAPAPAPRPPRDRSPRPDRQPEPAARVERSARPERQPEPAARVERSARPERHERPERDRRDREHDGDRVVGFGADTPAFLMRAVAPRPSDD